MKFFIVLAVALFVVGTQAATEEQKKLGQEHAKECIASGGVDPALVQKLKAGDFTDKSEKIQCFAKCFFQKAGFMDAEGHFQEQVAVDKLSQGQDKDKVEKLVNLCKTESGANACETAHKIYECYHKNKVSVL